MQVAINELSAVLSFAEALEIVRRWGNRRFRVPMKVGLEDPLALTLGLDRAQRLVHAYGGQVLELPAERNALRRLREDAIWRLCVLEGRSHEQVGIEFGLSRRHVGMTIEKMRARRQAEAQEVTC